MECGVKREGMQVNATVEEAMRICEEFNNKEFTYVNEDTLVSLFEKQTENNPHEKAVVYSDETLTYKELNEKANQLAMKLIALGVQKEDFVAVVAQKCPEMVAGILAILKAGAAYVPIDPSYPHERIQYILKDANVKAVLIARTPISVDVQTQILDLMDSKLYQGESENIRLNVSKDNLACAFYTSGTTGNPKGVLLEHRSIINSCRGGLEIVSYVPHIIWLQMASVSFVASAFEIWTTFLSGGCIVLVSKAQVVDPYALKEILIKNQINTMFLTPSFFAEICSVDRHIFSQVKNILTAGEELKKEHIALLDGCEGIQLTNMLGSTENSPLTSYYRIPQNFTKVSVGRVPKGNSTKVYILNEEKLCGIGEIGEICIAGEGLSRGYLNLPELTKEKFKDNPYGEGRIYKSGDFARWLSDGNIEFLGREDDQIKIRGMRVELTEVESVLRKQSNVKDVVVIGRKDNNGNTALYAYVVPLEVDKTEADDFIYMIRERISKELPDYMIPTYMMLLKKIPVNQNGKIDKKSLPQIQMTDVKEYISPRSEKEKILVRLFQEVLSLENISISDKFLEIGGDSLKAIRLISKLKDSGYVLDNEGIRKGLTIGELAQQMQTVQENAEGKGKASETVETHRKKKDKDGKEAKKLIQSLTKQIEEYNAKTTATNKTSFLPLVMHKFYIVQQMDWGNICSSDAIHGKTTEEISKALKQIIRQQGALRTCYDREADLFYEYDYSEEAQIPFLTLENSEATLESLIDEMFEILFEKSIFNGKIILDQKVIVKVSETEHAVLSIWSHVMGDKGSVAIFSKLLNEAFEGEAGKKEPNTVSYAMYINEIHKSLQDCQMPEEERKYYSLFEQAVKQLNAMSVKETRGYVYDRYFRVPEHLRSFFRETPIDIGCEMISRVLFHYYNDGATYDAELTDIPVLMMYHGRNSVNERMLGLCLSYVPLVYNRESKKVNGFRLGEKEVYTPAIERLKLFAPAIFPTTLRELKIPSLNWWGTGDERDDLLPVQSPWLITDQDEVLRKNQTKSQEELEQEKRPPVYHLSFDCGTLSDATLLYMSINSILHKSVEECLANWEDYSCE